VFPKVIAHQRYGNGAISAAAIGAATASFGAYRLGHQSLWHDEAFSVQVAQLDLSTLFHAMTRGETSIAFHCVLLHFWQYGGNSEVWLRLLSVFFGVGTVLALFALNTRLFGLFIANTSCSLLAVNLFFIRYMQEARAYTLVVLLAVVATFCFVTALDRPTVRHWVAYAVVSALAVYAHLFAAFVIAAHLLSLAMRRDRPRFPRIGGAYLLAAIIVSPLAALVLTTDPLRRAFVPRPRLGSFEWLFLYLTGGGGIPSRSSHLLLSVYFVICCAALIFMARTVFARGKQRTNATWSYVLVLSWLAVPVLSTYVLSFVRPILYPRYLIVVLPSLVTIAALGIQSLPHRVMRCVALGALLALSVFQLPPYYGTSIREGGDWRSATEYVLRDRHPGDGILFLGIYGRRPFEYYLGRLHGDGLVPLHPAQRWGAWTPVLTDADLDSAVSATARLRDVNRVWAMLNWGGFASRAEDASPLKVALEDGFKQMSGQEFGPSLEVRLYEREGDRREHVVDANLAAKEGKTRR
jgi:hypothetical protein